MVKDCSCLRPLKKPVGELKDKELVEELNYALYDGAQKDCKADERSMLGFTTPQYLSKRLNGLTAYTRVPAQGVWADEDGRVYVDDNYLYSIEFKNDEESCIFDRAKDLLSEVITRKIDIPAEKFPYIYLTEVEDSTL